MPADQLVRSALTLALLTFLAGDAGAQTMAIDSVRSLTGADRDDAAMAYAEAAVRARPGDADALCAMAVAQGFAADDWEAAVEAAERCVDIEDDIAEYQFILGESLMELAGVKGGLGALGPARKGKAAVERAISLDPDHLRARLQLFYYLEQAPGIAGGSKRKAKKQAEEIYERDRIMGLYARYRLRAEDAKEEERVEFFDEALPLAGAPADSSGYAMYVCTATAASVDTDVTAERLVSRLYDAHPDDVRARYFRGRLWAMQGRYLEEAEAIFVDYIARDELPPFAPSVAGAHWRLGLVYEKQGRKPEALEQYRAASEFLPDWEEPKQDIQRLERELGTG
jgi:tetratricopeptide (TPR) repeat protein